MSAVDNIMGLTKYMVTLPVTKISLVLIIVFSFITGTVAFFLEPGSTLLNSIIYGGSTGILIFGLMTILSGAITTPMVNSLNGRHMKMKQSMFLAFVTMLLIAFIYIIGSIVSSFTVNNYTIDALIYACALAFALRTIIIWGTSNISFLKSVPIAAVQPVLIMCMVVVVVFLTTMETNFAPFSLLALMFKIIIACLILMLAIYAFVLVIESPIRRNLGVGGLELLSLFIAHITEESNALESLFEGIGEPIDTLVGVVSFKTKDGVKAILVSPCVHPGPVGSIGGGNMPTILANKMETFTMVCHGPSTHDFNPVSSREINKIADVVNNALESMEYVEEGSPFFQLDYEEAKLGAQFLGKNLILLATFAPDGFDDIEFGVGLSIVKAAEAFDDVENVILVDCHNSFQGEHGRVLAGNKEVFQLLGAVEKLERPAESGKIRVGCAFDPMDDLGRRYGVGQSGVKTMLVQVADQKTAYILLDANNMIMGFRDELIQAVKKIGVDCAEIMTTDAHYVNTLSGGHNPIGVKKQEEIKKAVVECTKKAIEDLEDVDVGCKTSILSGIKTLGPLHATELVTTISSIVAVSRIFAPLVVILALLFAFIWIFYGNIITA
jgi:putative membrane protein